MEEIYEILWKDYSRGSFFDLLALLVYRFVEDTFGFGMGGFARGWWESMLLIGSLRIDDMLEYDWLLISGYFTGAVSWSSAYLLKNEMFFLNKLCCFTFIERDLLYW